ncbi:MAG: ABC transporter substrate-binding protein [Candidatus Lambdaproteobacteria bacterium]|nr:ABC transporter substrate-binding protein [Candidatus Lambdaproteobacteria bacterium]
MTTARTLLAVALGATLLALGGGEGHAQRYGGILRALHDDNPPSLSIHEEATTRTTWVMVPTYSNLVWYDPFQPRESLESIRPDLAEQWGWSEDGLRLTFTLRQGVRWHDGKPVTGSDVKHTWDMVRGVSAAKLKLNPRKGWYFNLANIVTNGDREVTFVVKRPQPSLLAMLATGYSPVTPAHVAPPELRTRSVGTGPFRLKEYVRDQRIVLEKNPDYFVKGRPYLDGIEYPIVKSQASRVATMVAGKADLMAQSYTPKPVYDQLLKANVGLAFAEQPTSGTRNIIVNAKKPPFDNPRVRRAVALALDRQSLIQSVFQGGAVRGSVLLPAPQGRWGLTPEQLAKLPGYGAPEANKEEARRVLAAEGYGPEKPLRFKVATRNQAGYTDVAAWVIGEMEKVGVKAELETIEVGQWFGRVARREFQFGLNATALAIDDPDAAFYENYKCGSQRNYTDYCNPELEKLYDKQSSEFDFERRLKLAQQIDITITEDGARPMLVYRIDYHAHAPYVRNIIPHPMIYNAWRFTEVWLDK